MMTRFAMMLIVVGQLACPLVGLAQPAASATPLPVVAPDTGTINWWLLAGTLGTALVTTFVMAALKKAFPGWENKAWAPPLIGAVMNGLAAMTAGEIHSTSTLVSWLLAGFLAGGLGSSARDVMRGK